MQHTNASKTASYPSLIDTLSQGYKVVNRCWWVLAIPFVLDLLYWLGPRVSLQPLYDQAIQLLQALNPDAWDALQQQGPTPTALPSAPLDLTPFGTLSALGLPKFLNILGPLITLPQPPFTPSEWRIGNVAALFGLIVLIVVTSFVAVSIYLLPLGDRVRSKSNQRPLVRRWLNVFGSIASVMLIVFGVMLALLLAGSLMVAVAGLIGPAAGEVVALFGVVVGSTLLLWLLFTTSFAFDAIVISDVGPIRALLTSLFVVQRSFWSAFGLLVLGWVILVGMSIVWQILATNVVGTIAAMLGSAYISSGLAAAHLIFYRDRLSRIGRST